MASAQLYTPLLLIGTCAVVAGSLLTLSGNAFFKPSAPQSIHQLEPRTYQQTKPTATPGIDRSRTDWLDMHCKTIINQVGELPTTYERKRGPFTTLPNLQNPTRTPTTTTGSTCTQNYLLGNADKEAFAQVGVEYAYSEVIFEQYHQAVISKLTKKYSQDTWVQTRVDPSAEGVLPQASYYKQDLTQNLMLYLDIFFTKDEEVVFELTIKEN
jgi:hypothetical protein